MTEADVGMATQVNTHAAVAEGVVVRLVSRESRCTHRLDQTDGVLHHEPKLVLQLLRRPATQQTLFTLFCNTK